MAAEDSPAHASDGGSERHPRLIVFDLDYTLWPLWIDTHVSPPFRREGDAVNAVNDSEGNTIRFYQDVPSILKRTHALGHSKMALCSRTHAPEDARTTLDLLLIAHEDGSTRAAREFFAHEEIYPGSKIAHFKSLYKKTGVPFEDMIFFDDEYRNSEVSKLGVTFILVKRGLDEQTFQKGLQKWRNARSATGS
ncbi:magnesium-dependent phosphatase-1 [Auricularia subglabra TFB-10046 SS5]|nr:magnesium-dependent phosphatase-1 [Auricularia subglabra TFB-10046 SS5]